MTHPTVIKTRILWFRRGWLLFTWLVSWAAYAQTEAQTNLLDLPWFQAFCAVWVTIAGGTAATLERKLYALYHDKPFYGRWEFPKDISVSVAVGLFSFFIGVAQKTPADVLTAILVAAGYGGTRVLSGAVDRMLGSRKPEPTMEK